MEKYSIFANNYVIYSLIGNYKSGQVTTIYGNAACGKSTCCLLAAIEVTKKNNKVIYIDTENKFSSSRLEQLNGGDIRLLDQIFLIQVKSFEEQHDTILKLHKLCDNDSIKLIIVDTIGHHYRNSVNEDPEKSNEMLVEQMKTLVRIARDLNKVVIVTNQVYDDLEKRELKMVGGSIVPHMSKVIIELNKKEKYRYATCIKYKMEKDNVTYYNLGKKIKFDIVEKGFKL